MLCKGLSVNTTDHQCTICKPYYKSENIYFVFFLAFVSVYPNAVGDYWNPSVLSGILILGIPIEELAFAFSFGMMWSSVYEHINWYRNK